MRVSEPLRAIHGMIQNAGKRSNLSFQDIRIVFLSEFE